MAPQFGVIVLTRLVFDNDFLIESFDSKYVIAPLGFNIILNSRDVGIVLPVPATESIIAVISEFKSVINPDNLSRPLTVGIIL